MLASLVVLLSWYRICFFVVFWVQPKLASSQEPGGGGASSALPPSIPQSSPGAGKGPLTRKVQDWLPQLHEDSHDPKEKEEREWGCSSVVKLFPAVPEALGSTPQDCQLNLKWKKAWVRG